MSRIVNLVEVAIAISCVLFSGASFAGSTYFGTVTAVFQYAIGFNGSGSLCYIAVPAQSVQNPASCAPGGSVYYYSWACSDTNRKEYMAMFMSAYLAQKKVEIIGSGQCFPHPIYENINEAFITDTQL